MRNNRTAVILYLLLPVLIIVSSAFGAAELDFITVIKTLLAAAGVTDADIPPSTITILMQIRLPRILLAAISGAGLAASGAVFQAVFQNPLAEPYLLGVSSGASLGATIALVSGAAALFGGFGTVTVFSFAGAALTIFLVMLINGKGRSIGGLLLGGIALGYIFQAGISLLMMLNRSAVDKIVFWMMGSFSSASWVKVRILAVIAAAGILILIVNAARLNILSLGADEAHSLGVDPERSAMFFLLVSCMITAAVVSVSGIIGFVGLLVPHLLRFFTGPDHRRLIPAAAAGGACLMLLADLAARTVLAPQEIPVGVITACVGGPFFLAMLGRYRRRN